MSEEQPIAEVLLKQGRYFLVVRGVYLAMEGDPSINRDSAYDGRRWTLETLREAADDINSGRFGSVAERWKGKGKP